MCYRPELAGPAAAFSAEVSASFPAASEATKTAVMKRGSSRMRAFAKRSQFVVIFI
jgi:hypothetical protein